MLRNEWKFRYIKHSWGHWRDQKEDWTCRSRFISEIRMLLSVHDWLSKPPTDLSNKVACLNWKENPETSLVVQRLRICPAMQGTQVWSLVGEPGSYVQQSSLGPRIKTRVPPWPKKKKKPWKIKAELDPLETYRAYIYSERSRPRSLSSGNLSPPTPRCTFHMLSIKSQTDRHAWGGLAGKLGSVSTRRRPNRSLRNEWTFRPSNASPQRF